MNPILDDPSGRSRLRRIVLVIVLASVGIHIIFGIGAGIWVIARYFQTPKAQFVVTKAVHMPTEDREHRMKMEETTSLRSKPVYNNRIQTLRPSELALPELPKVAIEATVPLDVEALISDQTDGMGRSGNGSGSGSGFFGGEGDARSGILQGHLYDLKQDPNGKPIEMNDPKYFEIINRLSRAPGTAPLRPFYRAPKPLYLSRVAIPMGKAEEAPKAFAVADKVDPRYWIAVYSGRMVAPKTGTFKFLGYGDDFLLVRINGRLVFDGSHLHVTRLSGREGVAFSVVEGKPYDIDVFIGECPGSFFGAWLQIEEQGTGEPPHWFRMGPENVEFRKTNLAEAHRMPEHMVNGPVWSPAASRTSSSRSLDAGNP